jgi:hypothetical protein
MFFHPDHLARRVALHRYATPASDQLFKAARRRELDQVMGMLHHHCYELRLSDLMPAAIMLSALGIDYATIAVEILALYEHWGEPIGRNLDEWDEVYHDSLTLYRLWLTRVPIEETSINSTF